MDELTQDQRRQLSNDLWNGLRAEVRYPTVGRLPWFDLPITRPAPKASQSVAVKCGRCDGKGAIASFSVRYSGVCFACGGSGFRLVSRATYEKKKALRKAMEQHKEPQSSTAVAGGEN